MLGAIIGDIVGSRFEFNNTNRTDFELFTDEYDKRAYFRSYSEFELVT